MLVQIHIQINRPIGLFGGKRGALGHQSDGFAKDGVSYLTTQLFVGIQRDEISLVSFSMDRRFMSRAELEPRSHKHAASAKHTGSRGHFLCGRKGFCRSRGPDQHAPQLYGGASRRRSGGGVVETGSGG